MTTSLIISRGRTVFIGDVAVHERPNAEQLPISLSPWLIKPGKWGIRRACHLVLTNFGNPRSKTNEMARAAVAALEQRDVDFEFDGEMTGDIALDYDLMKSRYPFCRLSGQPIYWLCRVCIRRISL
ncbi:MAG: hypothetical protein CM15mP46_0540 [Alphaproteobacteria bacterium]|nr:MAG: hypothetical protein CM15mP46_0540 [Alphaproteobacteria bacterium]